MRSPLYCAWHNGSSGSTHITLLHTMRGVHLYLWLGPVSQSALGYGGCRISISGEAGAWQPKSSPGPLLSPYPVIFPPLLLPLPILQGDRAVEGGRHGSIQGILLFPFLFLSQFQNGNCSGGEWEGRGEHLPPACCLRHLPQSAVGMDRPCMGGPIAE